MNIVNAGINRGLQKLSYAVLAFGWLCSVLFFLNAEGIFDFPYHWQGYEFGFVIYFAMLAVPFLVLGLFLRLHLRFTRLFLVASLAMLIGSCYVYYEAYFPHPQDGSEWVFMLVPMLQITFSGALGLLVSVLNKLHSNSPNKP